MSRISLFASTAVVLCAAAAHAAAPKNDAPKNTVTHGPILGRLTDTGIHIWARTKLPGEFRIRYGESPRNLDQVSEPARTTLDRDNTGVVKLTGLKPGTKYYYHVECGPGRLYGGSFRTLPNAAAVRNDKYNPRGLFNFSFEFACGNNPNQGAGLGPTLPTYDTLNRKVLGEVDFAILNGDWLYEEDRDYPVSSWRHQVGLGEGQLPHALRVAPSITGVWENYKTFLRRGANLAHWHRNVPSYFTFDDHELLDDIFASAEPGFRDRRAVFRDMGVKAWFDYLGWANPTEYDMPTHFGRGKMTAGSDVLEDPSTDFTRLPLDKMGTLHVHWEGQGAGITYKQEQENKEGGDPNSRVYAIEKVLGPHRLKLLPAATGDGQVSYSIGRRTYGKFRVSNCEFFLLDTRTHRTLHDKSNPAKPTATMLGHVQRDWLIKSMRESDADFFFVVSSVNFMIPHVGGGGVIARDRDNKDDAWTVFLHDREMLIDFWDKLEQPVFVLTGDLHNSFAIKISDNVWEFASGPHNSVNHRPEDEGNRPLTGKFKYGPRECLIRWSTTAMGDIPREHRNFPTYCVVQVNNVFNNPLEPGGERWIAYPHPQVIFQYYDGLTGKLRYAETITKKVK